MLHLSRWISFGMNVTDLFQLQCTFQSHREIVSTSQIQEILSVFILFRQCNDLIIQQQGFFYFFWDGLHLFVEGFDGHQIHGTSQFRHTHGHQRQNRHLRSKRFGTGNPNLWSCMGISTRIAQTRNTRAHNVTNTKNACTFALRQIHGRQRICGFSTLRNGNHQIIGVQYWISIPKLGSIFHFHRNSRQILKQILCHQTGVPTGTTTNQN